MMDYWATTYNYYSNWARPHAPCVPVCVGNVSVGLRQEHVCVVSLAYPARIARGPAPRRRQPVPDRADDLVELVQDPD